MHDRMRRMCSEQPLWSWSWTCQISRPMKTDEVAKKPLGNLCLDSHRGGVRAWPFD